mgnify:CR=1 FL=1
MSDKIVTAGLKIDFHIHSSASYKKDGDLVKDGSISHINILLNKLKEKEIDMFAITDHDQFDYSLYHALTQYEGRRFKKVLPGVEFSVGIEKKKSSDSETTFQQIHVIAIFNDANQDKLKNLEKILNDEKYDCYQSETDKTPTMFQEKTFRSILQKSDLNVCLIAHQKNSPTSKSQSSPDVMALGQEKYNELINYEYFEAYEFKTENNRIFHNLFKKKENKVYERVRFITGSDCHEWKAYPKHHEGSKENEMTPTFLKCLPSFRGLAMALTDDSRIQQNKDFFSNTDNYIESIKYSVNGNAFTLPLSKGINAIIGDNSKGKSMFLHALTNYSKLKENIISEGKAKDYKDYLSRNKIIISPIEKQKFSFDSQGEIRKRFELGAAFAGEFISKQQPKDTDSSKIKEALAEAFNDFYDALEAKFQYDQLFKDIKSKKIQLDLHKPTSGLSLYVSTIPDRKKVSSQGFSRIESNIGKALLSLKSANKYITDNDDIKKLNDIISTLEKLEKKYKDKKDKAIFQSALIDSINIGIKEFTKSQTTVQNNNESVWSNNENDAEMVAQTISQLISIKRKIKPFKFKMDSIIPEYESKTYGNLNLISRFVSNEKVYGDTYCTKLLQKLLKSDVDVNLLLDIPNVDRCRLLTSLKNKDESGEIDAVKILKSQVENEINQQFKTKQVIIENGADVTSSYSAGFNAAKYLNIISNDGADYVYIVDQPEDDISQTSIRRVINDLKTMSKSKQVILVTHNPQFVVNLDVDNVLYFYDDSFGKLHILEGALEYIDEKEDMIKLVSENLDGGIESLKKRWKRYEKNTENHF